MTAALVRAHARTIRANIRVTLATAAGRSKFLVYRGSQGSATDGVYTVGRRMEWG